MMKKLLLSFLLVAFVGVWTLNAQVGEKKNQFRVKIKKTSPEGNVDIDTVFDVKEVMEKFLQAMNDKDGLRDTVLQNLNVEVEGSMDDLQKELVFMGEKMDSLNVSLDLEIEDDGEGKTEIKMNNFVWVTEDGDGEKTVMKYSEKWPHSPKVIKINEENKHVKIIKNDGHEVEVIVVDGDSILWNGKDAELLKNIEVKMDSDFENQGENVFVIKTDGDEVIDLKNVMQTEDVRVYVVKDKEIKVIVKSLNMDDKKKLEVTEQEDNELLFKNFSFYPNPTDGRFTLDFVAREKGTVMIEIFDAAGKRVYKEKLKNFEGNFKKEMDISGEEKGIYFLRISQNDKVLSRKIVIE